jgi:ribosome biogenesis protein BMS1
MSGKQPGFRVAATGVVTELDHSFKVVKKLKLVGYVIPMPRHTAPALAD